MATTTSQRANVHQDWREIRSRDAKEPSATLTLTVQVIKPARTNTALIHAANEIHAPATLSASFRTTTHAADVQRQCHLATRTRTVRPQEIPSLSAESTEIAHRKWPASATLARIRALNSHLALDLPSAKFWTRCQFAQ